MSARICRPKKCRAIPIIILWLLLVSFIIIAPQDVAVATDDNTRKVVIHEIAWMGTTTADADEWIELYNPTAQAVDLSGWTLVDGDEIAISLSGIIPAQGYYLLERKDDASVPGVVADQLYSGNLLDTGETLTLRDDTAGLIDEVPCSSGWFAGHAAGRVPMERIDPAISGNDSTNWTHNPRCGSATNSFGETHVCTLTVTTVGDSLDYTVYFNERATTATYTTTAQTRMERALLGFLERASSTIDMALYGLNRQSVVDSLIAAHNRGLTVRVVGDDDYASSYQELQDAGITVITDTRNYRQHNKFVIIDGWIVWTGSTNFTDTGLTLNANNGIVITSTLLAGTYTSEFEEMWAGLFQSDKQNNTLHQFDYQGTLIESFFSPTDLVAFEVWEELGALEETLHFAMFFWTDDLLTERVVERLNAGVEVYGVWDALGAGSLYSADKKLSDAGAEIRVEDFAGKVHHKFAVLDVHGDNPRVVLGSYNWTDSGGYNNDENTLIIHSAALAQAYYEEWKELWDALDNHVYLPLVTHQESPQPTPTPTSTPSPTNTPVPTATPKPADIQITHIEFNPDGDDVQGEYVQLENQGGEGQTMTNWTLRDEANHVFTFPSFSLGAGKTVWVWTKNGSNSPTDLYWGSGAAIWNNTGDTAYLEDNQGNLIDTYAYSP